MMEDRGPAAQWINVASLVTFADEFIGEQFFGKASKPKGAFVEARFSGFQCRTVDVTFRPANPGPLGYLDVAVFPVGAVVRIERRRLGASAHDDPICPYHDPLDECCADPEGWHDWQRCVCDNCGQVKPTHNACDSASVMGEPS